MPSKSLNLRSRARRFKRSGAGNSVAITGNGQTMEVFKFQHRLSTRNDTVTIVSKAIAALTIPNSSSSVGTLLMNPNNFGGQAGALVNQFTKFRIVKLIVSWKSGFPTSSSGRIHIGVLDDSSPDEGSPPAATGAIAALRTYNSEAIYRDCELVWTPQSQKGKGETPWYYTQQKSGDDVRFEQPCTLFAGFDNTQTGTSVLDIYYVIEMCGQV